MADTVKLKTLWDGQCSQCGSCPCACAELYAYCTDCHEYSHYGTVCGSCMKSISYLVPVNYNADFMAWIGKDNG